MKTLRESSPKTFFLVRIRSEYRKIRTREYSVLIQQKRLRMSCKENVNLNIFACFIFTHNERYFQSKKKYL